MRRQVREPGFRDAGHHWVELANGCWNAFSNELLKIGAGVAAGDDQIGSLVDRIVGLTLKRGSVALRTRDRCDVSAECEFGAKIDRLGFAEVLHPLHCRLVDARGNILFVLRAKLRWRRSFADRPQRSKIGNQRFEIRVAEVLENLGRHGPDGLALGVDAMADDSVELGI